MRPEEYDAPAPAGFGVLVVDDSRTQHAIVGRYLEGTEFRVRGHAYDGEDALRLCLERKPDLVLLDLVLPGSRDGTEVLDRILAWNPGARVAVASALNAHDLVRQCRAAGARAFLPKPFTRDQLIGVLREAAAVA